MHTATNTSDTDTNENASGKKIGQLFKSIQSVIVRQVRQHPIIALGAAVGAGFALSGGLSTKAGRLALLALLEYAVMQTKNTREERADYLRS
jgi:hypothetical protein